MTWPKNSSVAGVFTQNAFCAAPVTLAKERLGFSSRALLVNSGNANAGLGEQGINDAKTLCNSLAVLLNTKDMSILPFSTGVIGEPLPVHKIEKALPIVVNDLRDDNWSNAAHALMTTDTVAKGSSQKFVYKGETIFVTGIGKGSGMIKPNMATMLAFIATNACINQELLQTLLSRAVNKSFNRITIDGDTSTNDSCLLIATGQTKIQPLTTAEDPLLELIQAAIEDVCMDIAQSIVRDGEGATKFIRIFVTGGLTTQDCLDVGYAIANSPLVKTAFFASDPNWGRILAAIGYSGVTLDINKINVSLGDVLIVEHGCRAQSYNEEQGSRVMSNSDIDLHVELGMGSCHEVLWTTDLSHEYVRINAEYRS
ncbi:UNVERIFIED_CONTAM: hypothetical protein GTU68_053907 [Idotea baltica]|nr:hypothetical protein [Idotea baltica]